MLTAFAILVMSLSHLPYPRSAFKLIQKYKSTKIQINTFAILVMSLNPLPSPRSAFFLSLVFGGVGCARSKVSRSSTQKMVSSTFCYWNILKAFEIIKPAGLWHKQIFRPHDFFHRRRPWWLFSRVSPCLEEESSSRLASLTCCPMSTRLLPTFKKDVFDKSCRQVFLSSLESGNFPDSGLPVAEILVLAGFLMIYLLEEALHLLLVKCGPLKEDEKSGGEE